MKLSQQNLSQIYADHVWLKLSNRDLEIAQPNQQHYSNETGRNYAYLNRLCLNAFLEWSQENLNLETPASAFPNEELLAMIWEFVTGCGINLYGKRLVLIPSDAVDMADFAVPQEWVDIPNLAADYYLPVQIDIENRSVHFWGFVSRRTLKAKADYDPIYRLYYVEGDWVIPNLEMLEGASNFCNEKGQVAPLGTLTNQEAENLIIKLSKPSPYSPRLKETFEKWSALLNQNHWIENLYKLRLQPASKPLPVVINLSMWLDGIVQEGWQTFDEWFNTKIPAFRTKQVRGIELETPDQIKRAVRQFRQSVSAEFIPDYIEDRDALVYLLQHTQDETIRWKAAEYLWAIDPNYPNSATRKVMDLGIHLMGHPIALMIAVLRKINGKVAVLLRAYPMSDRTKLPPDLQLVGLDENGDQIPGLEATARREPLDDYIQLYFSADVGDRFSVRLTLEDTSITEQFIV